jgi:hypothetical protein
VKYFRYGRTDLLEVGAGSGNLVNEIFYGENFVFAERLLDDGVVGKGNTLLVDLAVAALVNEFTDGLDVWLAKNFINLSTYPHRS